ncbi:hypothetical protein [Carbonactinospora thermoautotrophica]|nr:hypothetical protein [Carbonactinospora thermoautotrophica]
MLQAQLAGRHQYRRLGDTTTLTDSSVMDIIRGKLEVTPQED